MLKSYLPAIVVFVLPWLPQGLVAGAEIDARLAAAMAAHANDDPTLGETVVTGYFPEDWNFLKARLGQLKAVAVVVDGSDSGLRRRNVYLRETLSELLQILKYVDYSQQPLFGAAWMNSEEWRETGRNSAMQILQELGAQAAPSVWSALEMEISRDTPARKELYKTAREALKRTHLAYARLVSFVGDKFPGIVEENGWLLNRDAKAHTRIAWKALIDAHGLCANLYKAGDHNVCVAGSGQGVRDVISKMGSGHEDSIKAAGANPNTVAEALRSSFDTDKDIVRSKLKNHPDAAIKQGRDGKLHRMVTFQMYHRNEPGLLLGEGWSNDLLRFVQTDRRALKDKKLQELVKGYFDRLAAMPMASLMAEPFVHQAISIAGEKGDKFSFMDYGMPGKYRLVPLEQYRSSLKIVLEHIGAPALAVLENNKTHPNPEVARTAQELIRSIKARPKPQPSTALMTLENIYQRRARVALMVWDLADVEPGTDVTYSAEEGLRKLGAAAIPDILAVMSIEEMDIGDACGKALELLTGKKFGNDYPSWQAAFDAGKLTRQ